MWDAGQYLRFGGERSRPFFDLTAQIGAADPEYVVDLGCGPGNLTAALADRWPAATVAGVDSSPEMIAAARKVTVPGLSLPVTGKVVPKRSPAASLSRPYCGLRPSLPPVKL